MANLQDFTFEENISTLDRANYDTCESRQGKPIKLVKVCQDDPIEVIGTDEFEYDLADGDVSAAKVIYKNTNGVTLANSNQFDTSLAVGISRTAATDGNSVKYKKDGKFEDSSFNFPLNDLLFLTNNGSITNIAPTAGFRTVIGHSLGIGAIQININEPIEL